MIYLLYIGKKGESQIGYSSSGGLSCHNSTQSALKHGMYELVERDAINICWNCKIAPKKIVFDIEPKSIRIKNLFKKYHYLLKDISIYLHYVTNNAYVVTAIKKDSNIKKNYFLAGGGVSLDIDNAIEGAITEFIQAENNLKHLVFTPDWFSAYSTDYLFNVPEDVNYKDLKLFYQIIPYYGIDNNFKKLHWYLNDGEKINYSCLDNIKNNKEFYNNFYHVDFTSNQLENIKIHKCFNENLTPAYIASLPMKGHSKYSIYCEGNEFVEDPIPFP